MSRFFRPGPTVFLPAIALAGWALAQTTVPNPDRPVPPAGNTTIVPGEVIGPGQIQPDRLSLQTPPPPPPAGSDPARRLAPAGMAVPMAPGTATRDTGAPLAGPDAQLSVADNLGRMEGERTFARLASESGLAADLGGDGPWTVFVPTDDAFSRLPPGAVAALAQPAQRPNLKRLLSYHVVASRIAPETLQNVDRAGETLALKPVGGGVLELIPGPGGTLQLRDSHGTLSDVMVTPIPARNGTLFVVNGVLMP
jgi:uncharacterized surface protein with fasciclin (FAS1) repeats